MYAAQQLDRTPQRNQIEACVSRPAAAKISAWRTFRGRTLANAKATCDAMSPERRSRCQVRATNLSPIRLLLPPAAAAKLASDATEAAAEALQARQETAKLSRTLAERRAHSRRRLWAKRTHTAATQLQQAWRCRVARDERARRAEAQAALARRKEAARLRLATREAEVREECEKRRQGRAAKAQAEARRTQAAATQLQQAWRCRMARGERTRRVEAQAALARRKEAARARLARREAEVREEREKRQRERALKAEAATEVQVEEAKVAQVEAAAVEESTVTASDTIEFEWSSVTWSDIEWSARTAEAAVQTEAAPRRLHITDVTETGCQADCALQEVGCQTDAHQAALAGSAVVSGGLLEPAAVSGGVRPTRSGGKQRKALRQARRQREAAQLEAQQQLAASLGGGEGWQEKLEERLEVARARYRQGVADRALADFSKAAKTHGFHVQRSAWEADW